ncbi:MAG: sulfotransferase domain-containing protein [Spirulinaceae cyanobacterium SM2_1_0]|nr:sulfotransferase domain-containing protein [Spirulinaceae cyanobacterium SM2_1_0]
MSIETNEVIVVCGFARSGTSLTMQMLQAAGVDLFYDDKLPIAFETPKIFDLVIGESQWLSECRGKAFKLLDPLDKPLPEGYCYKIIWLDRRVRDMAVSSANLLKGLMRLDRKDVDLITSQYMRDKPKTVSLLRSYVSANPESEMLTVRFQQLVEEPAVAAGAIASFLGIDAARVEAMTRCVIPRSAAPMNNLLEPSLLHRNHTDSSGFSPQHPILSRPETHDQS